ncbi:DUF3093 family protein [Jatrophihabitans sp.]|jgi:hypothetical protein|uniref:DUF3093 family protein n=1 Tax=Jatrophihabitans sp. TaxID=1932789 RepID=UPI002F1C9DD2
MAPATRQPRQAGPAAGYFERLRTPWWWYLGAVGVSVLLGLEFAVAVSGWIAWVPFALVLAGSLLVVWQLSSGSVSVGGGTLRAGERTVPVARIEQAIDLSAGELRRLVGRHSDPLAFTYIRSWVGPGVQLVLRPPAGPQPADRRPTDQQVTAELPDPDQDEPPPERLPEPYWVVSTRHPDRLLAAIQAARP